MEEDSSTTQSIQSKHNGQGTLIAKMARFPWEIQYIEAETRMYQLLQSSGISPRFLGNIHGEDRLIDFLLEKIQG